MLIFHILKIIWIKIFHKIIQEMRILLLISQKLPDYYYIFGYYISGWDHPTENVITENEILSQKTCIIEGLGQNR